ncbi:MAG: hypothetical protein Q8O00_15985 [Holophaga sp.]|nr:hypothetical protein [Holophaga sp.]
MGLLDLFRAAWNIETVDTPWDRSRVPIFQFISSHLQENGSGLRDGGESLPDELPPDDTQVRWAAGALDGVGIYHGGWAGGSEKADQLLEALISTLKRIDTTRLDHLYSLLKEEGAISIVDPVLEKAREAAKAKKLDTTRLWRLAHWLAKNAPDREPVKFAMAILGMFIGPDHRETLMVLGRHDEFTLYAAVAVGNTFDDPETSLWDLAKGVQGWGRIHSVERLAKIATRPEIKHWLLIEGHHNAVMPEYLASPCATGGGMLQALMENTPPDAVLVGSAEILDALVAGEGGPFEGLETLPDGPEIVRLYLDHVDSRGEAVAHYITTHTLKQWAEHEQTGEEQGHPEKGTWPSDARTGIAPHCQKILVNPAWKERIQAALDAEDKVLFAEADRAAGLMGMDVWPIHMDRLRQDKGDGWWSVTRTKDAGRMAQLVALAEERLPLEQMATGPDVKMWGGPLNQEFNALDFILQALDQFPGLGWPLINTGLQSPVIRTRNMAIKALEGWEQANWPDEVRALLEQALAAEPNEDTRKLIERLFQNVPEH